MNHNVPKALIDAIQNNKLVIFVGAGVSVKEGFPSWKDIVLGMLEEKKEYIEKASDYKAALQSDIITPLEVLDKIEKEKKYIYEYFESTLIHKKGKNSGLVEKLGKISRRFVTTNFDALIENNIPDLRVITKDSQYGLTKIDTEESYVLKLHGDLSAIDNCVIFTNHYDGLYTGEKLAEFQLKKILSQYTVLFIGFSFNDEYVKKLFGCLASMMDGLGPTHFIISTEKRNIENLQDVLVDNYSEIDEYIDRLVELKGEGLKGDVKKDDVASSEKIIKVDGTDMPPVVRNWVGREKELDSLNKDFKVYFITGIGGQGKSALAAYYLESLRANGSYEVYDWRDFKEEDHKFENKITSMIALARDEKVSKKQFAGLRMEELVDEFFSALGKKRCVFVLDNVDSYIDLEEFEPLGGIGVLFNKAICVPHNSKFIFTCRPFVRYASIDFFQFALGGLGEQDVVDYFNNAKLSIKPDAVRDLAVRSYELTKGHPLWISLILAQAKRGEKEIESFLNSIRRNEIVDDDQSSILSESILGKIWASLTDKHKLVLRSLAESVQSLTIDDFSEIVSDEMTYNRFVKSYKAIKNLGLVIEKAGGEYVELHPLVKEFIRKRFPGDERAKFIYMFIKYYDKIVLVLKPKLGSNLTFEDYSNWTNKVELYANAKEYQESLDAMYEIHDAIKSAGYIEEYLRVALIVFRGLSWARRCITELNNFDRVFESTVKSAIEYGDNELADFLISKYESIVENKDPSYIKICEVRSYKHWFLGDFASAIEVAEKAKFLLKSAKQPDSSSLNNDYALALRDSGADENMKKALEIFLMGEELDSVTDYETVSTTLGGVFYGNVGRCLHSMGRFSEALNCLYKSFLLIYDGDSSDRLINLGYAGKWIYEAVRDAKESFEVACYFYMFALNSWEVSSPPLYNRLARDEYIERKNKTIESIMGTESWRIESYCYDFVRNKINQNSQ